MTEKEFAAQVEKAHAAVLALFNEMVTDGLTTAAVLVGLARTCGYVAGVAVVASGYAHEDILTGVHAIVDTHAEKGIEEAKREPRAAVPFERMATPKRVM